MELLDISFEIVSHDDRIPYKILSIADVMIVKLCCLCGCSLKLPAAELSALRWARNLEMRNNKFKSSGSDNRCGISNAIEDSILLINIDSPLG